MIMDLPMDTARFSRKDMDDLDDMDDFNLHNLNNMSFRQPQITDPDTGSNSSSSASTVIHNPNSSNIPDELSKKLNSISLSTLESDPTLTRKLHTTLSISNANNKDIYTKSILMSSESAGNKNDSDNKLPYKENNKAQQKAEGRKQEEGEEQEQQQKEEPEEQEEQQQKEEREEQEKQEEQENQINQQDKNNIIDDTNAENIGNGNYTDDPNKESETSNDYIQGILPSPPSSPPRELDPDKLYALFDFNGPDPSHLELYKDDSVLLLNDSDAYWWLVRRLDNSKVGFAPAEILETYQERLARLNCWKNEILERGSSTNLSMEDLKLFHMNSQDSNIQRSGSLKKSKSINKKTVSFANIGELKDIQNGNESNDNEDDASFDDDMISETNFDQTKPLFVPKRVAKQNFLVRSLDDYNYSADDDDENENDIDNDDDKYNFNENSNNFSSVIPNDINGDIANDYTVLNNVPSKFSSDIPFDIQNGIHDANNNNIKDDIDGDNYDNVKIDHSLQDLSKLKKYSSNSMKMLDQLIDNYPEFNKSTDFNEFLEDKEDHTITTTTTSLDDDYDEKEESSKDKDSLSNLHPTTTRIFTPLFSQLSQLEQMINDIQE